MFFIMLKAFKYRLRPTKRQARILAAHLEECRMLYNHFLVDRIQAYQAPSDSTALRAGHLRETTKRPASLLRKARVQQEGMGIV